jgi:hypothetical protein
MGGLDARAYVENFASPGQCYDYQANVPDYSLQTCTPGSGNAAFVGDVAEIVTVDTPPPGDPLTELSLPFGPCWVQPSTNRTELNFSSLGGAGLVEALNYSGTAVAGALPSKNPVPIHAVQDYFSDVTDPWDNFGGWLSGYSDDVVVTQAQSILLNLPSHDTIAPLRDVAVSYLSSDPGINNTAACWYGGPVLHFMTCLGAQPSTQSAIATQVNEYANFKVATLAATAVTGGGATLNGTVYPNSSNGHAYFYWGTDPTFTTYTQYDCGAVAPTNKTQAITAALTGLAMAATYYFEIVFWNTENATYEYGEVLSFSTRGPPVVTTTAATSVTGSAATLNGTVNPRGANGQYQFQWGTDPTLTTRNSLSCSFQGCPVWVTNSQAQAFRQAVTDLPNATTYYFRLVGFDYDNYSYQYGAILSFTTGKPPAVTTTAATSVTGSAATLNGTVNPREANGQYQFQWNTDPTLNTGNSVSCYFPGCPVWVTNSQAQALRQAVADLPNARTYYFRLVGFDYDNYSYRYGAILSFTTGKPPAVTTTAATSVTGSAATLNGR